MDIEKLQDLINSNRIDIRSLNQTQRLFLKKLQERDIIKTKPLDQIAEEQKKAREEVAKEKNLYTDPIKTMSADKLNRTKVATYTDIGAFMGTLLAGKKSAMKLLINPNKGIQELARIKSNFKNPTLNKFFTGLKQLKATAQGTAGSLAAQGSVRVVLGGTTGYVGGALAYDLADEVTRDLMDLKKNVGDKTYKEMSEQNQLIRSLQDLRAGLIFNAGAELLGPLASFGAYGIRKGFGLETEYSRTLANIAKTNNLDATYIMLADPNTIGGKVLKTINRVFGQLPIIGGPAKQAQLEAIEKFNIMSQRAFNIQPGMHLATASAASEKAATGILKKYGQFQKMNDINFNRVYDMAKSFGDPRFIDLSSVGNLLRSMENSAYAPPEIKNAFRFTEIQTPLGNFIDAYKKIVANNRPISITEYVELRKMLNQTTSAMNKNDPLVATYSKLQTALEQDFARASLDAGREITLKFPIKQTDALSAAGGAVQQEVKSTLGDINFGLNERKQLKEAIEDAFGFYANNIKTFESRTARVASAFDQNALSLKQLQGFAQAGSVEKDQILKTLSRNILQMKSGYSFDAVTDLQKLLDADVYKVSAVTDASGATIYKPKLVRQGTKEGNKTLEDLWGAHVGDAYQLSFKPLEKDSLQTWIKTLFAKESAQAQSTGMYRNLSELRGPNGLPINNMAKGNLVFDPDVFRKLILPNEAAATQFRIIFGPQKANKMLKQYDDFLSYMDAVKSYVVPDPSTFLARRLVLTGGATGSFYGLGVLPTFLMLFMGRYANKILSNPRALENINAPFKSFLEKPGSYGAFSTQTRFALAKLGNYFLQPETGKTYDESDVSMQEMHDFFRQNNVPITDLKNLNMEKTEKDNLFPPMTEKQYEDSIDDLPPPEDLFGAIGGMPANLEEEAMMKQALAELPADAPITPTTLPRQQGLRIPGAGIQPPDYSELFPFDPLGNIIDSRRGRG